MKKHEELKYEDFKSNITIVGNAKEKIPKKKKQKTKMIHKRIK